MPNLNTEFDRGSIWKRWDLHLHTKGTNKNDRFTSATFDDFCVTLFTKALENDIAVIGITDYFSIDNYKKVVDFVEKIETIQTPEGNTVFTVEQIEKIKNILLLPNVELRMMPSTDSGRLVNIHCIFNPTFVTSIDNDFFNAISYSAGSSQSFLMNQSGMISLGKSLDPALDDASAYKKGVQSFVVSHGDLQKLYDTNKNFSDNVVIVVSNSNNDGASGLQKHYDLFENDTESQLDAVRKSIYSISHAIFSGNPEDKDYFLGLKGTDNAEKVIEKCGSIKPCVHGSDAHTEEKLFAPDQNRFCWIKSNATFEGLKQILWEPTERVVIQERSPLDSKSNRVLIDKVVYKKSSGEEASVVFNGDLNSIIGVRGSGKSTLIKNIAITVDPVQFAEKDVKEPYPLDSFKVIWADGQENSGTDESPKSIFYVPQSYLSSLAYDDGEHVSERDQFLTELLKKNVGFANAVQLFENFVSENKVKIEALIQKLISDDTTMKESQKALKKQGSKAEIESEIVKKDAEIKKFQSSASSTISEDEIQKYTIAKKSVEDNSSKLIVLNQDKEILSSYNDNENGFIISLQELGSLSSSRQEFIKAELYKNGKESLTSLIAGELAKINEQIESLTTIIAEKTVEVDSLAEKIKQNKAIGDLTIEVSNLNKALEKITELTSKISESTAGRTEAISGLVSAYADYKKQQDVFYKTIKFDRPFSFLKIEIVTKYNAQQIKSFVERNINTRDSQYAFKQREDIKQLFGEFPSEPTEETIKEMLTGLIDGVVVAKVEAGDTANVISQLLKNRYEIDYLNSVKTLDGEIHFKDMTGGQKAIALLELIFSFDDEKYPILIDQPEDDLDVGGIATDLVKFIKAEKKERQIIIVTHNASLVVCSDSEEVITSSVERVAASQYDFSYFTGAIENPQIREDIIRVLEGGRDALKMRARKLNFKQEI